MQILFDGAERNHKHKNIGGTDKQKIDGDEMALKTYKKKKNV